jgi:4-hydroxy-2-oxoheptanedioate aldolase
MKTTNEKTTHPVQFGFTSMYPAPGIIERVGPEWDWIWIDGQHGEIGGYTEILSMVRACNLIGKPAFVRVPSHELGWISMAQDMNADGVIVPQVESVEEAKAVVQRAKFPPVGNRSYGGRRPIDFLGRNYSNTANTDKKLICQIESEEALQAAEHIAALPGVDGLFLGPDDMMLRKGHPMDQPRSKEVMADCIGRMVRACEKHGKIPFTVAVGDDNIAMCVSLGVKYIVSGGDVPFLVNGSKDTIARAREVCQKALSSSVDTQGSVEAKTIY